MDSDYKKYSLGRLEEWMHDAMSVSEASPQEIYDVIMGVVKDNYYTYKHQTSQAYELLALLNGNGGLKVKDVLEEREYYDGWDKGITSNRSDTSNLTCDKDDPSPECQKSWNDFWATDNQYTEEELNAMCDKAASDQEKEKCREYNLREAEYYDKRVKLDGTYDAMIAKGYTMTADGFWIHNLRTKKDKVKRWVLPVQQGSVDGVDDYYIEFPDDLLEAANLKEGDQVEWVDKGDGSYLLRKV